MGVKKVVPKKKKVKKKTKKTGIISVPEKIVLPAEPKEPVFDFLRYTILIYGREKIGKTTLFKDFPDTLFITTEPGTKGLRIYEISVSSWKDILETVKLLEKSKRFKHVVFDTADRAYDMCLDGTCTSLGIEYPGEDDSGRQDFGRSWRKVKQNFIDVIHRIERTGRGVGFTSHMQESTVETRSGSKYTRIYPSMSKQARGVIEALVDLFFFADYVTDSEGKTRRVLITEGDETIWAGHRELEGEMPQFLPLKKKGGHKVLQDAFSGKHPGIDPSELRIGRQTSDTTAQFLLKNKAKIAKKKQKVKKVSKKS